MKFYELGDLVEDFEIDPDELQVYRTSYLEEVSANLNMILEDLNAEIEARENDDSEADDYD